MLVLRRIRGLASIALVWGDFGDRYGLSRRWTRYRIDLAHPRFRLDAMAHVTGRSRNKKLRRRKRGRCNVRSAARRHGASSNRRHGIVITTWILGVPGGGSANRDSAQSEWRRNFTGDVCGRHRRRGIDWRRSESRNGPHGAAKQRIVRGRHCDGDSPRDSKCGVSLRRIADLTTIGMFRTGLTRCVLVLSASGSGAWRLFHDVTDVLCVVPWTTVYDPGPLRPAELLPNEKRAWVPWDESNPPEFPR